MPLTRRRFLRRALLAAAGLLTAACTPEPIQSLLPSSTAKPSPTPPPSPTPTPSASPSPTAVPSEVAPLRDKIARLLLIGFRGTTADEASTTIADIRERKLGGVLLFDVDQPTGGVRNVVSPEQVAALTGALQDAAGGSLIVAIDQEGGRVARLNERHGFPPTRSAAVLGATGDPSVTGRAAAAMAQTLSTAGVTLNLAPVVDLNLNPANPVIGALDRSFGADANLVVAHASAFIAAHRELGVHTALKHFPGQGSATGDTHTGFVDVTGTWTRAELAPFDRLIEAGSVDAVMTAHIFEATLDPEVPATLSRRVVTDLLRGELGWDGPTISDDLQMGAIAERFGYEEALRRALLAGIDLLLVANQQTFVEDLVTRTVDIVERLVSDGEVPVEVIDAAEERVRSLRTT
ncbi:MAG TPA: glycoside hydrolase family 3 N-terminal domain-containing protein [Candidatus Limnocylindria bacterium]|nr:glycoside hydrolase family 3 N-terminal domain-containing protein [Candidatus Limnocylindria bacterium]